MTITPRPLHSLASQWRRLKQTVEVTVISSAGLTRFIARQILHANVNTYDEIRYRSVMGESKFDVSAGEEITRLHSWGPIIAP